MKPHFLKISASCFMFFAMFLAFAQKDIQGKAYYESKTTFDASGIGDSNMTDERRNQIASRMKSMLDKTYVLTFNQLESIYKEETKAEDFGDRGNRWRSVMNSFSNGPQYKNVKSQELIQDQEFYGKQFLIKDILPKIAWQMASETKQIGNYTCFKATTKKMINAVDFTNFRRLMDSENQDKDVLKEVDVEAWYTLQIPVNQGPDDFWGLPGLILELNIERTVLYCTKIIINPEEKIVIEAPSKGKEISRVEYNALVKKKTEEMRANFNSRGPRR